MTEIADDLVQNFANFIENELGIYYPKERYPELIQTLKRELKLLSNNDLKNYMSNTLSNPSFKKKHFDRLSEILTVNETYFFRPGCGLNELKKHILPTLIDKKSKTDKTIRIWSAGCCYGDEPFSIAILIDQLLPFKDGWNIHILGTDICRKFLERAQKGSTRIWSFRNTEQEIIDQYFKKQQNNEYKVIDKIRKIVHFAYLNLVEDFYPALENGTNSLDIILCNNTLMYFSPEQIQKVVNKLISSLSEGGYLIVSTIESSFVNDKRVSKRRKSNIFVKEKNKTNESLDSLSKYERTSDKSQKAFSAFPSESEEPIKSIYLKGDYSRCIEKLENKSLTPPDASILIKSYANSGRLNDAKKLCEKYLNDDSLDPLFHFLLASILQEQNQYEKAILELKRALFLDPKYIMAHFALAYLFHIQGKNKESQTHKKNVIRFLDQYQKDDIVPGSDQIKVSRLKEMVLNIGAA